MNDFSNAYALSGMFLGEENRAEYLKADAALLCGRHPVLARGPAYCRFTDGALRGDRVIYLESFPSRAEAEAYAAALNDDDPGEGEFFAYPEPPKPKLAPLPADFDADLPF